MMSLLTQSRGYKNSKKLLTETHGEMMIYTKESGKKISKKKCGNGKMKAMHFSHSNGQTCFFSNFQNRIYKLFSYSF